MSPILRERLTTPEVRTGLYYSAMFLPPGVATLLLPIWLDSKGISPEEIGIISAVPIFIMIVLNLFVGRIADRARDWRSVIVAGSLVAGVVSTGFIFVDDFWGILIVNTLCVTAFMAIEPVIDAAAIRLTRRRGSDFALVRIWGTFGYIAITGIAGVLFGWIGIAVFVPMFIAMSLLRAGASLPLPFFRAPDVEPKVETTAALPLVELSNSLKVVMRPWFVLTLAGTALLQASHMLLVSFGALLWVQAGVPEVTVGILWMIAPICEIVTMLAFARLSRRFSARHLLVVACACGVVRWAGMAYATEVWQMALLQALHMGTYGLAYMGIINFIANWTGEEIAAQTQSLYVVMRQVASVALLVVFGPLVAAFGMQSYLAASVASLLGGLMIIISLSIMRTKR